MVFLYNFQIMYFIERILKSDPHQAKNDNEKSLEIKMTQFETIKKILEK